MRSRAILVSCALSEHISRAFCQSGKINGTLRKIVVKDERRNGDVVEQVLRDDGLAVLVAEALGWEKLSQEVMLRVDPNLTSGNELLQLLGTVAGTTKEVELALLVTCLDCHFLPRMQ